MNTTRNWHALSLVLMITSLTLVALGIAGGFIYDEQLTIPAQIGAHLLLLAAPLTLKVGYVLHLATTELLDGAAA